LLVELNSIQGKQVHKYRTITRQTTENPKQGEASVSADCTETAVTETVQENNRK